MIEIAIENQENDVQHLAALANGLKRCCTVSEKVAFLSQDQGVLSKLHPVLGVEKFPDEWMLMLLELSAIGQLERLFEHVSSHELAEKMRALMRMLTPVEAFYRELGGIVGYHAMLLRFLLEKESAASQLPGAYHQPDGINLIEETEAVSEAIEIGIRMMPIMAEMYPVGGAADRLRLCDPETLTPLPAAKLHFCGRTLLEGLILDLQAREYVYYQLFGQQIVTPVAMMTSQEKDNHAQIVALCSENQWFGRPSSSFRFFCQPTVPTIDAEGNWCLVGACSPLMKPGGHGVIWKVAKDCGVFEWFKAQGRRKLLVRQINNPIAGCDYGLLAFTGIGCQGDKAFGFASCLRQVGSAEGVNVMTALSGQAGIGYCLTNIEYCDFKRFGIEDEPVQEESEYSKFPSNTNILFADVDQIVDKIQECPIPGMLVNLKKMVFHDEQGCMQEKEVARLESTMQNIADCFVEYLPEGSSLSFPELKTYLTFNQRRKTISTTKREFQPGLPLNETPEGCYYDHIQNAHELLTACCHFTVPKVPSIDQYLDRGASFDFSYHPALGPLYGIIAQKLRGGVIAEGSEWVLDIAEIDVEHLSLDGSLKVIAERVMGHHDGSCLIYSGRVGRCVLTNVTVRNNQTRRTSLPRYWKGESRHPEACEIRLKGESLFIAQDVVFEGNMQVVVEDGMCMTAWMDQGRVCFKTEPLAKGSALWRYVFNQEHRIDLMSQR